MRAVAQVGVRVSFPIKWLAGQAYHRSCRGCPVTCGVTPNMAASSRGGFVSPWHARTHTPATPHPPPIFCTQTESLTFENISHSSTQACICNHTYLSQTIQSSRVTGVMQRLMYRSRGSKRKRKKKGKEGEKKFVNESISHKNSRLCRFFSSNIDDTAGHLKPSDFSKCHWQWWGWYFITLGGGGCHYMTQARSSMCVLSGPLSFHQWQNWSFSHSHGVHSRTDYTHSNVELNTVYTVPTVIVLYFAFCKANTAV